MSEFPKPENIKNHYELQMEKENVAEEKLKEKLDKATENYKDTFEQFFKVKKQRDELLKAAKSAKKAMETGNDRDIAYRKLCDVIYRAEADKNGLED